MVIESEADDKLKSLYELSRLYDIYGGLLNEHSRGIFEDYVLNNLSLAEIAAEVDLSRQGVRDVVVRCSKKLHEYEDSLGLLKKFEETDAGLRKLKSMLAEEPAVSQAALKLIDDLRALIEID